MKIDDFKERYQTSLTAYETNRSNFEKWQDAFEGTLHTGGKRVKTIFNFTKELIESQIDSNIPPPKVEADIPTDKNKQLALVIEKMLRAEAKKLKFDEENDEDERTVKIAGGSLRLLEWDNNIKTHSSVGGLSSLLIHPLQHIPQEGVYHSRLMDYHFLTFEKTKKRLKEQYGKDVKHEGVDTQTAEATQNDETATQVICYYKNKKGTIGVFSWAGDTILIDDEEYNARGKFVCSVCGDTKTTANECKCGQKKWEKRNLEFEELTEDITLSDGTVIPAMSLAREKDGSLKMMEVEQPMYEANEGMMLPVYDRVFDEQMNVVSEEPRMQMVEQEYYEPTNIPYYVPKSYPICIRKNVSAYKNVLGDSDCAFILELQDNVNKISAKMLKKELNAGSYLAKLKSMNFNFSNSDIGEEDNQTIEVDDIAELNGVKAIELKFDAGSNINTINQFYMWAKSLLGVNDSAQGKPDSTAQSGKAKEIQVARALGRQESKIKMKNVYYAECYRVMFEYLLAYADEPRKYNSQNDEGEEEEIIFNRYDFLEQDEFGNWYYNDEFTITVDAQGNAQENRQHVIETMDKDFASGLYGNPTELENILSLWKDRESMGYPNAKRQVSRIARKLEEQKAMREEMARLQGEIQQQLGGLNAQTYPEQIEGGNAMLTDNVNLEGNI